MKKYLGVYIQLSAAMVIVGSNVVVGKLVTANFPVFLASTLRFAPASLIFLIILWHSHQGFLSLRKKDLFIVFFQAFFGNFLFTICLLYGLRLTSAMESGILLSTTPIVTAVFSFLFLHERLTRNKMLGILLVVLGVVVINVLGIAPSVQATRASNPLLGNLLIGGAVLGEAVWTIFGKAASREIQPLALASVTSFFGLLMFLPFGFYEALHFNFSILAPAAWIPIAYFGVVGTVGGYLLWYRGMSKVPASTAGAFFGLLPVSSVVLSYIVLKEPLTWSHLLGVACVLLALLLIAWDSSKPAANSLRDQSTERRQLRTV